MNLEKELQLLIIEAIAKLYNAEVNESQITLQKQKRIYWQLYLVTSLLRISKKAQNRLLKKLAKP